MKMVNKKISALFLMFVLSLISAKTVYAGWIAPQEGGSQAEVGKVYQIQYETGVWHNTTQYCDIRVTDPDGTIVHSETFQFSGIGVIIESSFVPAKIGKYTIEAECYYYITQTFWNGPNSTSYTTKSTDNIKTETLNVVKELPKDSSADVLTIGSCEYTVNNNQATITAPESKTSTKLTIPATIKVEGESVPVTAIAPNAFKGMKKLKTVTIGKNIRKIGKNAFRDCKKLKTIKIKTSKLTSAKVGANAFKGIYSIASIKVPKKKLTTYRTFLKKKGIGKKVLITKY